MVAAKPSIPLERSDGLIGKWVEEPGRWATAVVVYTIRKRQSRVYVTGVDESDGIALKISRTEWDGRRLRFVSLFPPTKHRAAHEFVLTGKARAKHKVTYSDETGEHTVDEVWRKVS